MAASPSLRPGGGGGGGSGAAARPAAAGGGWLPVAAKVVLLLALLSPPHFSMRYLAEPAVAYAFVFVLAAFLFLSTAWSYWLGDPVFKTTLAPWALLSLALGAYHWDAVDQGVFVYIVGALGVLFALGCTFIANLMGKAGSKRAGYVLNVVSMSFPLVLGTAGAVAGRRDFYQAGVMTSLVSTGVNLLFNKAGSRRSRRARSS